MSVSYPRDVPLLYLIVLACTLVSGEDVPIRVNGLINQSVLLSLPGDPSLTVQQVIWNYGTDTLMIYTNNQLTVIEDQYKGRLEILDDGRALRIGQLRLEDSGKYTGTMTFTSTTKHKKVYNLSVYEPVLTPNITIEDKKNTSDWCNVTLHCSVPTNTSSLSYTWKYRHRGSDYQVYSDSGEKIRISLQPKSWETEVLCIVHNPADSKNDSLHKICPDYSEDSAEGNPEFRKRNSYVLLVFVVLVIVLVALGWYLIYVKRKRRKAGTPAVTENTNGEPQYIQVTTSPSNHDREEWNNTLYDSSPRQKPKAVTVYAMLEYPPRTDDSHNTHVYAV